MRNGTYILCNCKMLDINHNHTLYFNTKIEQEEYFFNKKLYTIENTQFHRKDSSIKVSQHIDTLQFVNYVLTRNSTNGKTYFYFVYDKVYLNDNNTQLILKLDVIQTYLFDMDMNKNFSLVERMHVQRYRYNSELPNLQNLINPENLEVGEYIEKRRNTIHYTNKGGFVVASSDKLTANNGGSTGDNSGSVGNYKNGKISRNGFRFLKGYEGFASSPYYDTSGIKTIGYGTTEKYDTANFNSLYPVCTEEEASIVMLDSINTNYALQVFNLFKKDNINFDLITQNKFDAFVSLCYNGGLGAVTNSPMYENFKNNPNTTDVEMWESWWVNSGGVPSEGLRLRRIAEKNIFLNNEYEMRSIAIINTSGNITGSLSGNGWLPTDETPSIGENICESARKLIGKPYVWGGNYPPLGTSNGTDCSGLCQWAFNDNGKLINRTTYTQIKQGFEVTKENLQKGDLVFTNFNEDNEPEHVFLYSGVDDDNNLLCIEAPREGLNIRERVFTWASSTRARRLL